MSFKILQYLITVVWPTVNVFWDTWYPPSPRGKTRGELIMVFIVSEAYTYVDGGSHGPRQGAALPTSLEV